MDSTLLSVLGSSTNLMKEVGDWMETSCMRGRRRGLMVRVAFHLAVAANVASVRAGQEPLNM